MLGLFVWWTGCGDWCGRLLLALLAPVFTCDLADACAAAQAASEAAEKAAKAAEAKVTAMVSQIKVRVVDTAQVTRLLLGFPGRVHSYPDVSSAPNTLKFKRCGRQHLTHTPPPTPNAVVNRAMTRSLTACWMRTRRSRRGWRSKRRQREQEPRRGPRPPPRLWGPSPTRRTIRDDDWGRVRRAVATCCFMHMCKLKATDLLRMYGTDGSGGAVSCLNMCCADCVGKGTHVNESRGWTVVLAHVFDMLGAALLDQSVQNSFNTAPPTSVDCHCPADRGHPTIRGSLALAVLPHEATLCSVYA